MFISIRTKINIKQSEIMKNLLYIILLFPFVLIAQTPGKNYVKTTTYKQPYTTIPANAQKDVQVNYFDGLGRPIQTVNAEAGGDGQDIISILEYDIYGRQTKEYLPYALIHTGTIAAPFYNNSIDGQKLFYNKPEYENTLKPYSEKRYDNSPLNKVLEQSAPGNSWELADKSANDFIFNSAPSVFVGGCSTGSTWAAPGPAVSVEIKNNILIFKLITPPGTEWMWGTSNGCKLNLNPILIEYPSISIPNLELGELKDNLGNSTGYKAMIQNGYIQIKPVNPAVLPLVKMFNTTISADLNPFIASTSHTLKFDYQANATNEVRRFGVDFVAGNTENTTLTTNGYYAANQLFKNITKDENWVTADESNKTTEEFTDKQGRLILKRAYTDDKKHDTYYVYDKFSNLTYVIPPLASDAVVKSNFTISSIAKNVPWTKLVATDAKTISDFDIKIQGVPNADILNLDYMSLFGGRGGFSIVPDGNNTITLNLNITTSTPMAFKTGIIADLATMGSYANKELGRIKGTGYEYIFVINNNKIQVTGGGNLSFINTSLNGNQKLEYSQNYPWTKVCITTPAIATAYENAIKNINNSDILTTYTGNANGASGGVAITLDEFDTLTLSLNVNSNVSMNLATGNVFPLDIERSINDRRLGAISGTGYSYEFFIKNNYLYVTGTGKLFQAVLFSSQKIVEATTIEQQVVNGLCYIYHYDKANRVVEKHIPDNGWTHIVYDKLDRPILTQDENQRLVNEWMYTKYDVFERVAITGVCTDVRARKVLQDYLDVQTFDLNVTKYTTPSTVLIGGVPTFYNEGTTFPSTAKTPYTFQYYDNYFPSGLGVNYVPIPVAVYGITPGSAKGLPTVSYTKILSDSNGFWVTNVVAYDDKARVIWNKSVNNLLGTEDTVETKLNFIGNVAETTKNHTKNAVVLTVYDYYTYNNANKPLKHTQKIGTTIALIAQNKYDALGRLEQKKVGGSALATVPGLQTVDFTYNIRGWLKTINAPLSLGTDLFAFGIKYDNNGTYSLYNGNISQTSWRTLNDNTIKTYNYQYDDLNRLKNADFTVTGGTLKYNEGNIIYDANGNIMALTRSGLKTGNTNGVIDNLSYVYKPYSNQLLKVTDAANDIAGFDNGTSGTSNDYDYYTSGNLKKDLNKGIGKTLSEEITYNHLNLPLKVTYETNKYVEYIYSATGEKIQKTVNNLGAITTTQYANGYIYENNVLQYFPTPEGYVKRETNGNFTYVYQYKDHLGNVRLSYSDTNKNGIISSTELIEESNYYPFGMKHEGYNAAITANGSPVAQKIKYQGQERQDELKLNWDSFKWRNYDYAIGRFMSVDPLAEKYVYNSPYAFQENKLGMGVELEGLEMVSERSKDGKSITLTMTVKPVNNTGKMITDKQFRSMVDARKAQTIKSFNGKTGEGLTVNTRIVESNDATITWEYNTMLHGKGVVPQGQSYPGHVDTIGDTQNNRSEVNVVAVFGQDDNGNIMYSDDKLSQSSYTGTHEDGHNAGLKHPAEYNYTTDLKLHQELNRDGNNNLMKPNGGGTNITALQRSIIIQTVEEQQPKL